MKRYTARLPFVAALICVAAACSSGRTVPAVFSNPLAGQLDIADVQTGIIPWAAASVTALQLATEGDDRLLRSQLLGMRLSDKRDLHAIVREHGYVTLDELLPHADELLRGSARIAARFKSDNDRQIPLSEMPIALPLSEFTFADNMRALQFAGAESGKELLRGGESADIVLEEINLDEATLARAEAAFGRQMASERGEIALRHAVGSGAGSAYWQTAFADFQQSASGSAMLWQVYALHAIVSIDSGDDVAAAADLRNAITRVESLRVEMREPELRKAKFRNKLLVYELLIECLVRQGLAAEALRYAELAKARSLQDSAMSHVSKAVRSGASNRRRTLAAQIVAVDQERLDLEANLDESDEDAMIHWAVTTSKAWLRYQDLRRDLQREFYSAPPSRAGAAGKELRGPIDGSWIVLDYFLASKRIHLWIIGAGGLLAYRSQEVSHTDVIAAVGHLRQAIEWPGPYVEPAIVLYDLLLAPVDDFIVGRKLLIIPHDVLHFVPFEALMHDGAFVVQKHIVAYAPALAFTQPSPARARESNSFLGIANPDGSLKYSAIEVKMVRREFAQSEMLLGSAATREALLQHAAQFDVLHIAAHVQVSKYPLLTRILLAGGESLYLFEIPQLGGRNRLVVLSACNTNIGVIESGDEFAALGRGFLENGARNVIVTLWPVHDQATASLMDLFYSELQRGGDPASALAMAQRRMIDGEFGLTPSGDPIEFSHPYYWAGFVSVGAETVNGKETR